MYKKSVIPAYLYVHYIHLMITACDALRAISRGFGFQVKKDSPKLK